MGFLDQSGPEDKHTFFGFSYTNNFLRCSCYVNLCKNLDLDLGTKIPGILREFWGVVKACYLRPWALLTTSAPGYTNTEMLPDMEAGTTRAGAA